MIQLSTNSGFSLNSWTLVASTFSSPNREGGLTPRTVPSRPLLEMEPVLLGEIGVGHAVAVGDGEMAGVAEVLGGRAATRAPVMVSSPV